MRANKAKEQQSQGRTDFGDGVKSIKYSPI